MYNIFGCQVLQAFVDICDDIMDFGVFELVLFLDFGFQVSFVAELGDNVAVSIAGEDLKAAKDIGVIHFFEYFYF